jgi:NAD(P)-dependent dehydrogenase (short-subunit alcohol dehydrogenase family)
MSLADVCSPPVAVVTGGTRGIGRCIGERLTALGYRVISLSRTPDPAAPFESLSCDVGDRVALERALALLPEIDVLVNNAGVAGSAKVEDTTLEDWDEHFAVNVTATLIAVQSTLPEMRRRGRGRIITVASTAGLEGPAYVAAYAASKHAVVGLMSVLSAELAGSGAAAATVCPTYVDTDLTRATVTRLAERTGAAAADVEARIIALTPHGRLVTPEEVAGAVCGLLELPATEMNGRLVVVDGAR